ncbi:DUF1905 domain-containing protein [Cryobacterium sp. PH29-G1]|uniref:DUF1905 domain-containing protein n=1 Tax=Cryobacterium sp. PH29-G1 TaxID=3046211 RepID=UPI0024B87F1C|nr:DUF1905 domain-containing protein [Cryobacterium sp. PH29-G1]MDJ0348954.1 DUF1905 domain-containing protein [Cryobacterium sp. PH29-G1]
MGTTPRPESGLTFTFTAELQVYPDRAWYFVTVPAEQSEDIRHLTNGRRGGFGSVKIAAAINESHWATSLFFNSDDGSFILFVKKVIRQAEGVGAGDPVTIVLELLL